MSALVARFEQFNDVANPFETIKLCGAISDPSDYDEATHGFLSAVVSYHTLFSVVSSNSSLLLSFALGRDKTVDTIIGLPFIRRYLLKLRFDLLMYLLFAAETSLLSISAKPAYQRCLRPRA